MAPDVGVSLNDRVEPVVRPTADGMRCVVFAGIVDIRTNKNKQPEADQGYRNGRENSLLPVDFYFHLMSIP